MDKYSKRALEWCPDELEHQWHSDKYRCVAIAQALREAAAEARSGIDETFWISLIHREDLGRSFVACRGCGTEHMIMFPIVIDLAIAELVKFQKNHRTHWGYDHGSPKK